MEKNKLELSSKCPDNSRQIKLSFETGSLKQRNEALAEFDRLMVELCGQPSANNSGEARAD